MELKSSFFGYFHPKKGVLTHTAACGPHSEMTGMCRRAKEERMEFQRRGESRNSADGGSSKLWFTVKFTDM